MAVQTAERIDTANEALASKGEVVHIAPPRLPYHPAVQDRFNVDRSGWRVLVDATFPNAKSVEAVLMALAYCQSRKLDIFKRPVHIVPMWSSSAGRMVETVWPSIAELRTTAFRTKQYAGIDSVEWGPTVENTFTGKSTKGRSSGETRSITLKYPEWCRMTILRELNGKERKFIGPKVLFTESYATWADTDVPNEMWSERPEGQLEKCTEAAALRRAFPEEIGNDLTAEEMEGRRLYDPGANAKDVTPREEPPAPPPATSAAKDSEAEIAAGDEEPEAAQRTEPAREPAAIAAKSDIPDPDKNPEAFLKWADERLKKISDPDSLSVVFDAEIQPLRAGLFPPDDEVLMATYKRHENRLGID